MSGYRARRLARSLVLAVLLGASIALGLQGVAPGVFLFVATVVLFIAAVAWDWREWGTW